MPARRRSRSRAPTRSASAWRSNCAKATGGPRLAGRRFDLALGNPPYIADGDPHLAALRHEPRAGADSPATTAWTRCARSSPAHRAQLRRAAGCCWSMAVTRPMPSRRVLLAGRLRRRSKRARDLAGLAALHRRPPLSPASAARRLQPWHAAPRRCLVPRANAVAGSRIWRVHMPRSPMRAWYRRGDRAGRRLACCASGRSLAARRAGRRSRCRCAGSRGPGVDAGQFAWPHWQAASAARHRTADVARSASFDSAAALRRARR